MHETQVTANIVKAFNAVEHCRVKKLHSGAYGGGQPDVTGVYRGYAFFIEVKKIDGLLSDLQAAELNKWRAAGAETFVGIFEPKTKMLAFVKLDPHEDWTQFAGGDGVAELWRTSVTQRAILRNFDLQAWLDREVAGVANEAYA